MTATAEGAQEIEDLIASIERTPIATVITDPRLPDNPIIAANRAFLELTGYPAGEVLGRNCRFLAGRDTEPAAQARLRLAIAERRPEMVEVTNYRKDASAFRNAVMIAPVLDERGEALLFVGSQMQVDRPGGTDGRRSEAAAGVDRLTTRQRQVLQHLVRGHRNKQIAGDLGIGETTVKMHRAHMLARLGCATSADAIRLGVEAGLADS
jgi:PAS domain S-box-containing protein